MERNETKGVEYLNFVGLDQRMAYRFPGPGGRQALCNAHLQSAIRKMAALDEAATEAKLDQRLSAAGRAEQVAPQRAAAAQEIADAKARVNRELHRADAERAKLFAAPQLDPGDAVAANIDGEIRERFPSLPPALLDAMRADVAAAKEDAILHALQRDPIPSPTREWARAVWSERVTKQYAAQVAALDAATEDAEWALSALAALKGVLDHSASHGVGLQGAAA